eukprot:TRINITY_DN44516_c0_g1_i1.p1 TRINITY_DN44516_c0_g1~~TRINITY_DN44516_c0_g1_i1.p1  ORF type:complete len:437 (+),score=93.45 TRINITY_DN44516_c0_g1_i1:57-1367(+)
MLALRVCSSPAGVWRPVAAWRRRRLQLRRSTTFDDVDALVHKLRSDPRLVRRVAESLDQQTAAEFKAAREEAEGKTASESCTPRPSGRQLRQLFVRTSVPFVGFGFFDNMIMITVGGAVDDTLGVAFGFSTLAAAGIGQMASDSMGITLQGLIERFADRLGLPDPCLTLEQWHLPLVKWVQFGARVAGIIFGCLLGMFPLLFMPEKTERLIDRIEATLPMDKRRELSRSVRTSRLEKGEKLIERGQMSKNVYLIQSGEVEVIGRDTHGLPFAVCTIGPGHAFGEPELRNPAHVDLVARTDVVVQQIGKSDFLRLTGKQGREMLEEARSRESKVYMSAQGLGRELPGNTRFSLHRAKKGTGKTRFFADLDQEQKCEVLRCTGLPEAMEFRGEKHEGKVRFFALLSEEQKRDALLVWQRRRHESTGGPSAAAGASDAK